MTLLAAFTVLLALLAAMRLSRVILVDDIGLWYVRGPASLWAINHESSLPPIPEVEPQHLDEVVDLREEEAPTLGWRSRLVAGLNCPFCVGWWIGALVLLSLALVGGPDSESTAANIWRWVAGAFALNYVAAHLGSRLGDVDDLD